MRLGDPVRAGLLGLALTLAGCAGGPVPSGGQAMAAAGRVGDVFDAGRLISDSAGNLISDSAGNLISDSAGNLSGTARGPAAQMAGPGGLAGAAALRLQAYEEAPAAGALVVLTTPDERFYRFADGSLAAVRADAAGSYRFAASPRNKPVVVSVLLGRQRRIVGYTVPAGDTTVDANLATTYMTELLREEARRAGKTMATYDLGKLPGIAALTQRALDEGRLGAAGRPDLTISRIPGLVAEYLGAIGRDQALSDAWKDLLGHRPLAVTTLDMGYSTADQPGQSNVGLAADLRPGVPEALYGASLTSTFAELRRTVPGEGSRVLHRAPRLGAGAFASPYGIALERAASGGLTGKVWYVDAGGDRKLWIYDPDPDATSSVPVADEVRDSAVPWSASSPTDLTFDDRGLLYVVDQANHRVLRLASGDGNLVATRIAGTEQADFGGDGGLAADASFAFPHGITWGGGKLYVADTGNHRIRSIDAAGRIETVAGSSTLRFGTLLRLGGFAGDEGPAGKALLDFPQKAVLARSDGRDLLFVADGDNNRVRLVDLAAGTIRTVAGADPAFSPPGDGAAGGVALGQLTYLALDREGDLLISETKRVRRLALRFGL